LNYNANLKPLALVCRCDSGYLQFTPRARPILMPRNTSRRRPATERNCDNSKQVTTKETWNKRQTTPERQCRSQRVKQFEQCSQQSSCCSRGRIRGVKRSETYTRGTHDCLDRMGPGDNGEHIACKRRTLNLNWERVTSVGTGDNRQLTTTTSPTASSVNPQRRAEAGTRATHVRQPTI